MSCDPSYTYRPTFTASSVSCEAPGYPETRARATVANLFFRSVGFGPDKNNISVELPITGPHANQFVVRFNEIIVETYDVILGVGGIGNLRSKITSSDNNEHVTSIIEMPVLNYDIFDTRTEENDAAGDPEAIPPILAGGLTLLPQTSLEGGQGGPTTVGGLAAIRTGPERSLFIITTTEDIRGNPITPPASRRIQQWNGVMWISYCNLVPGNCPGEGTC